MYNTCIGDYYMENKYSIYKLKHKHIHCKMPERLGGMELNGYVQDIERDILNNKIIFTIDDSQYVLKEPKSINFQKSPSDRVIFTYGETSKSELEDEELLTELRNGGYIDDILKNNTTDTLFFIQFEILDSNNVIVNKVRKARRSKKIKPKKRKSKNAKKKRSKRVK